MEELNEVSHQTTLIANHDDLDEFASAIEDEKLVVFDAEGVNLSREGKATLAAVGLNKEGRIKVFLFDLFDDKVEYYARQVSSLKSILEDASVTKIIHDCRQDSDSFNEFLKIKLTVVFDTSVYNMKIQDTEKRENLNNTLMRYDCPINSNRKPRDFYQLNPNYWASRPLTEDQIACAAADVTSLFLLREKLIAKIPPGKENAFAISSENAVDGFRSLRFTTDVSVRQTQMGKVIGTGGCGIANIERQTGACLSRNSGNCFYVMAKDQKTLDSAKKMILQSASKGYY